MLDLCYECWKKQNKIDIPAKKLFFSEFPQQCDGCKKNRRIVLMKRIYGKISYKPLVIDLVIWIFKLTRKILLLPFKIYENKKGKEIEKKNRELYEYIFKKEAPF